MNSLFEWVNDPDMRKNSINTEPIDCHIIGTFRGLWTGKHLVNTGIDKVI